MCASSCALLPERSAGGRPPANGIGALIPTASPPECLLMRPQHSLQALRCVLSRYTIVPFIQQNTNLMAQVNTYVQMRDVILFFFFFNLPFRSPPTQKHPQKESTWVLQMQCPWQSTLDEPKNNLSETQRSKDFTLYSVILRHKAGI